MSELRAHQGSFEVEDGAFVVHEAPQPKSELHEQVIDRGIADGSATHKVAQGGRDYDPNQTGRSEAQEDLGGGSREAHDGRLDGEPQPERVVTHGYSKELGRVVQTDSDIAAQNGANLVKQRAAEARYRGELDPSEKAHLQDKLQGVRDQLAAMHSNGAEREVASEPQVITSARLARQAVLDSKPQEPPAEERALDLSDEEREAARAQLRQIPRRIDKNGPEPGDITRDRESSPQFTPPPAPPREPHPEVGPDNVRQSQWRARQVIERTQSQ